MTEKQQEIVTIDGPSGSGKSTISRLLAKRLGYTYLDTGAMYRAVGLAMQRRDIDPGTPEGEAQLAALLDEIDLRLAPAEGEGDTRVFLDGEEVSLAIRTAEMGMVASRVSAVPSVRRKLTAMQQEMGRVGFIVAEGRDTGTVVFPKARHKFFLDASPHERARRRQEQLAAKGEEVAFETLLAQIEKRDRDDAARSLAPLRAAEDAVVVDSTRISIEQVVQFMLDRTGAT